MTTEPMKLTDLVGEPLVGGTLIEYRRGYGFRREHARATITRIGWHPEQWRYFVIETDSNDAHMGIALGRHGGPDVWRSPDGACFWEHSCGGWCYAAVPQGVPVPEAGEALDLRIEHRGAARPGPFAAPSNRGRSVVTPEQLAELRRMGEPPVRLTAAEAPLTKATPAEPGFYWYRDKDRGWGWTLVDVSTAGVCFLMGNNTRWIDPDQLSGEWGDRIPAPAAPKAGKTLELTAPEALAVLAVLDEAQACGAAKTLAPTEEADYKSAVSKIAALATVQR